MSFGYLSQDERSLLLKHMVEEEGLVNHHLNSFNSMLDDGIPSIIKNIFSVKGEKLPSKNLKELGVKKSVFEITFDNVEIGTPKRDDIVRDARNILYPSEARNNDLNYSSVISVTANIKVEVFKNNKKEVITTQVENHRIGSIPILVGSKACNTYGLSPEQLLKHNMDPNDKGGYFILRGLEWGITNIENIVFGNLRIHKNNYMNELVRAEILSKPDTLYANSFEAIFKMLTTGEITVTFNMNKYAKFELPFFLIYRFFGISSDKEIMESIVDLNSTRKIDKLVAEAVRNSFIAKKKSSKGGSVGPSDYAFDIRDMEKIAIYIAKGLPARFTNPEIKEQLRNDNLTPENTRFVTDSITSLLNINFLPHVGMTSEFRTKKLIYMGYAINKMLKTKFGLYGNFDREALKNKRIHVTGESSAKIFKTHFNREVITPIRNSFKNNLETKIPTEETLRDIFSRAVGDRMEKSLEKAITSSAKASTSTQSKREPNRMQSQHYERKNQLNTIAISRGVSASNTTLATDTERSRAMRRVHPSYVGFICVCRSVDVGRKVGLNKEMAILAKISSFTESYTLKNYMIGENETDLTPISEDLSDLPKRINAGQTRVLINGDIIGTVNDPYAYATKYRQYRRGEKYHMCRETTVFYDIITNELNFYTDPGRMLRPLLVVYNTDNDPDKSHKYSPKPKAKWSQYIKLDHNDMLSLIKGKLSMEDMIKSGAIEYISGGEQENTLIAKNYDHLQNNVTNPLKQYTHCEIEQAVVGLSVLTAACGHSNQTARSTFQSNQSKQTNGTPCADYPHRFAKEMNVQLYNQRPLVETTSNLLTPPNGCNCILAIANYAGFNQEDSAVMCKASIDRNLFTAIKSTVMVGKAKDGGDRFGKADKTRTYTSRRHANFSKLGSNGIPTTDEVEKDDVIIGMYGESKNTKKTKTDFVDKSIVWENNEPALITNILRHDDYRSRVTTDRDDHRFVKVNLSMHRPVEVGDKFSSRSGQKMVVALTPNKSDMPFTENGIVPDVIMNPHSLPTRMTLGQSKEGHAAKLCATHGSTIDGTIFKEIDMDEVSKKLEKLGFTYYSNERMFDGITGKWIDSLIFITPLFLQRLQRYGKDALHSIAYARTCQVTHQPLEGKSQKGGLRIGEMEKDAFNAQGTMMTLREKFNNYSDGQMIYICRKCKRPAIVNNKEASQNRTSTRSIYLCKMCGDSADIAKVSSTWTANQFITYVNSMGIDMKIHTGD